VRDAVSGSQIVTGTEERCEQCGAVRVRVSVEQGLDHEPKAT
jgi:hypothetical protein